MEAHSKVVLNDGSPTRAARCDQSAGIGTQDVLLVDTAMADRWFLADKESYRPIVLTLTIRNVLERLVANRLSWWLEEHSDLSPWQAGFRKRCSTTRQWLWPSQFISHGFLSTQCWHTIAIFIDFSRAYDRVWCAGLLVKMLKMGISRRFKVAILMFHKLHSQSASEQLHRPL